MSKIKDSIDQIVGEPEEVSYMDRSIPKIYEAITKITHDIGKDGIEKERTAMSYKFRGIDDVYNSLSPLLSKHKVCILPRCVERDVEERQSKKGDSLFYVTLKVEFDFISAVDGSCHTIVTYGEAMDSSDKATNKAMSAAYKYACLQAFCIPTEGDNDTENHDHQVVAKQAMSDAQLSGFKLCMESQTNLDDLRDVLKDCLEVAKGLGDKKAYAEIKAFATTRSKFLKTGDPVLTQDKNGNFSVVEGGI